MVYLHGNSSCRLEGAEYASQVLDMNCSLVVFDFAGCGLSEGEYISLGYYEKDDIAAVI